MSVVLESIRNYYCFIGLYKDALFYNKQYYTLVKEAKDNYSKTASILKKAMICFEKGDYVESNKCIEQVNKYNDKIKLDHFTINLNIYSGLIKLHTGEIKKAIQYLESAKDIFESRGNIMQYTCYIYNHLSNTYIAFFQELIKSNKDEQLNNIIKKISKYSRLALKTTRKWTTHYGAALRVRAQFLTLRNNDTKAEKFFLMSIKQTRNLGRKYELALSYYEYGNFLNNTGRIDEAVKNWQNAYELFKEIDSIDYLHRVRGLLGIENEKEETLSTFRKKLKDNQLKEILTQCGRIINTYADSDEILERIMYIALETTGAQRGVIFTKDGENEDLELLYSQCINKKDICWDDISISIAYEVLHSEKPAITTNAMADERYCRNESVIMSGIKFILCLPVFYKARLVGVCYFDNLLSGIQLSEDRIQLITSMMTLCFTFLEKQTAHKKKNTVRINREKYETLCGEFNLTRREKEILSLVLEGYSNREIIQKLFISRATIKTHLNHIYLKTHAENREKLTGLFTEKR
jgi:DNA-binding CsgD family transcriptional regulator/tetratricopeptide (TPR) repeat protein